MTNNFNIKSTNLPAIGNSVDILIENQLIAVGYYNSEYTIQLFDSESLTEKACLKTEYFQCLCVKFNTKNKEIYFLAENKNGEIDFCRTDLTLKKIDKINTYPIRFFPYEITINPKENVLLLIGRDIEIWDLINMQLLHKMNLNGDVLKKAIFLSDKKKIIIDGIESNKLYLYDILNNFECSLNSKINIPFNNNTQMIISPDQKKILIAQAGMFGSLILETTKFNRILESRFNEEMLNSHYIFLDNDSMIVRLGKGGFNIVDISNDKFIKGHHYDSGNIVSSCATSDHSKNLFCYTQENKKISIVFF